MNLIIYYVAIVLVADLVAVLLCLAIEQVWPVASLPIFLGLYFGNLWGAWVVAVRLTEPKDATAPAPRGQPAE